MPEITIELAGLEPVRVRFDRAAQHMPAAIARFLADAGGIVEAQAKRNLSGPSHTRFPGSGNPFPGTASGRLKTSVTSQADVQQVVIGPNTVYAAIQEFGGTVSAKPGHFLAVPIGGTKGRPRDYQDSFIINGTIFRRKGKTGIEPLFALVKSVKIPARPYMRPALEISRDRIVAAAVREIGGIL